MKLLYLALPFVSVILSISLPSKSPYELLGLWISTSYLTWNLYAYLNSKKMLPPMNYNIDFSADGDKHARAILAFLCIALYILIFASWLFGAG